MYKTEAHVHTKEVSACGQVFAGEIIEKYAEAGYDTVFITDHINAGNFKKWTDLTWEEKLDRHLDGYRAAKEAGDRLGVRVLYGAELAFATADGHSNDYLIYDFDRDFLVGYEHVYGTSIEKFSEYARSHGVTVIQAHPYRKVNCCPTPDFVDGVEVCNSHPRHENNNDKALALAKERGLLMTVGSDVHMLSDAMRAYLLTEKPIESGADYIKVLREGSATLVTPDGEL